MLRPWSLPVVALLAGLACKPPQAAPSEPPVQDAARQAASGVPAGARPEFVQGFQSGAAMVRIAVQEGKKPFLLQRDAPKEMARPLGPMPEGVSLAEAPPAVEVDPATGLQVSGVPGDPGAPFGQGQLAGFRWALDQQAADLARLGLTRPAPPPAPPSNWTPWQEKENRVQVAADALRATVAWFPGILAWETAGDGFPPQRRWRPVPPAFRPLFVAIQGGALWVETRGQGAVALDPATGAIRAVLPAQAHPAKEGFVSYEAYLEAERLKLRTPEAKARLALLRKQAREGDPQAMYEIGRAVVVSDDDPDSASLRLVWYVEAARRGHVRAMLEAAALYNGGLGAPPDFQEARRWVARAAATGSEEARFLLETVYSGKAPGTNR